MDYESSYESGHRPFQPDRKRGHWANPNDFIYAGLGLAFRLDVFSIGWLFGHGYTEIAFIPAYFISLALYVVPFIIIQAFMGQFSSSGFISAFRLSPLFKGIGYVTLALNICVLTYYSIFAMVPLVYMFASMQSPLPWSCDGFKEWAYNLTAEEEINLCNMKTFNETLSTNKIYYYQYLNHHIPSVLYFKTLFNDLNLFAYDDVDYSMSWQLILCALLVWTIVAGVIYKYFNTEKFGQLIRWAVWILIALLVLFVIRFSLLPGAGSVYHRLFLPAPRQVLHGCYMIPLYGLQAFGPGWGLFITLSSFNKFKSNLTRSSWIIGFGQLFIIISLNLLTNLTEHFFLNVTKSNYYTAVEHVWTLYLSSGSVMAHMEWPHFWSILFFLMLFLGAMTLIIVQLYSILVTIFDEFVTLRERKCQVCLGLIGVMAVFSLYFTSNHGVTYFTALSVDAHITQTAINLLLILIVLWIYGRVRFQRDIEIMINQRFSTFKINILRFVAPLGMIIMLITLIIVSFSEHLISSGIIAFYSVIFILIPWLFIPGYVIHSMLQSMGSIKMRFQRCCRPTDWYPVEAEDRQHYEEAIGNLDVTHQLNEITESEI